MLVAGIHSQDNAPPGQDTFSLPTDTRCLAHNPRRENWDLVRGVLENGSEPAPYSAGPELPLYIGHTRRPDPCKCHCVKASPHPRAPIMLPEREEAPSLEAAVCNNTSTCSPGTSVQPRAFGCHLRDAHSELPRGNAFLFLRSVTCALPGSPGESLPASPGERPPVDTWRGAKQSS